MTEVYLTVHMNDSHADNSKADPSWFERQANVRLIIWSLMIACAGLLLAEWLLGPFHDDHHPAHFDIEHVFGYQALLGFVAFVVVVFLGTGLRLIIKRPEDYYDR